MNLCKKCGETPKQRDGHLQRGKEKIPLYATVFCDCGNITHAPFAEISVAIKRWNLDNQRLKVIDQPVKE